MGGPLDARSLSKASNTLEKAVVNFYRHLMMLENYALLNYTGFQKVVQGIAAHDAYLSSPNNLYLILAAAHETRPHHAPIKRGVPRADPTVIVCGEEFTDSTHSRYGREI